MDGTFYDAISFWSQIKQGKQMKAIIFVLLAAVLAFLFFQIILYKQKKPKDDVVLYTCDICGDRDCICHKENNINKE